MNFTIFFTNDCNLRCRYCYEKVKEKKEISIEVIDQTIEFMKSVIEKQEKNLSKLTVMTHGGEPLLSFEKIKYFVSRIKNIYPNIQIGMTTNGTMLSEDKINFISQNYSFVSVSIDGTQTAHDANRVFKDGSGSYSVVIKNLKELIVKIPYVQARMTVNPNNYFDLSKGIIELIEMGFVDIMPMLDPFSKEWTEEMFLYIRHEMEKVIKYIHEKGICNSVSVGLIDDVKCKLKNDLCDGGITTFSINTNGNIYPCILANGNDNYLIGNVYDGISNRKLDEIHRMDAEVIKVCEGCTRYEYCTNTRCKLVNEIIEGDANSPIVARCEIENLIVKLDAFMEML